MYFLNVGYKWNCVTDVDDIKGLVVLASYNDSERVLTSKYECQRVLFDPQLYLAGIDSDLCGTTCKRLATYSYFGLDDVPVRADQSTKTEWINEIENNLGSIWKQNGYRDKDIKELVSKCVEFQVEGGFTHVILPTPLIVDRESEIEAQAEWIDAGIEVSQQLDVPQPVLATVAIDEGVINEAAFNAAGFLDTIVDQVSSRSGLDGVYIVIAQTRRGHPYDAGVNVSRAYLQLSKLFRETGYDNVIVNFADIFGLVCLGAGASGFATGQSQTLRRLSLENFKEGHGRSYPHYYSHKAAAEFLPESELDKIVSRKLLSRVVDQTAHSAELLTKLKSGEKAATVGPWAESQSNTAAANKHFVARMVLEGARMSSVQTLNDKNEHVRSWLEDAAANMMYVRSRMETVVFKNVAPVDTWLELFDVVEI